MGFSPGDDDSNDSRQNKNIGEPEGNSNRNPFMEEQTLVGGLDGDVSMSPNALGPIKEPDATSTSSDVPTLAIPKLGFDLMAYCTERLKHHGYTNQSIENIFNHYQDNSISKYNSPITKWLAYCRTLEESQKRIDWFDPKQMDVVNWLSSELGPGKSTAQSTSRSYKRGPALFITIVTNKFPAEGFPTVERINLQSMAESGRRIIANKAKGNPNSSKQKYNMNHFLAPHYIYKYYRDNELPTELTGVKRRAWIRTKAIVLLRLDSLRRSGCVSRIPMDQLKINKEELTFKVWFPKGAQAVMKNSKDTRRITSDGYSSTLKIASTKSNDESCCTVKAVQDYLNITKEDRKEAYSKRVTVPGSVLEQNADFLFISTNRRKRSMKKNDVETSFDNITTFRKISSQKISNEISSFFKTQLFPSLPEGVLTKEINGVDPHILRHWGASNYFMRLKLDPNEDSPMRNFVLNLAGWIDQKEFQKTYDIRPELFFKNSRKTSNIKSIPDKLRARTL
jgi:hypothetical protein